MMTSAPPFRYGLPLPSIEAGAMFPKRGIAGDVPRLLNTLPDEVFVPAL